ncbi:MAG TPA: NADH-quinone oxidoreductase subunit C [Pseudonocardiaceae bacterium]|nr:NADH-quinone oxidoreductase subunit C [Pseudonocardiaceae bacterium]
MSRSAVADPVGALRDSLAARTAHGQRFAALLGRGDPATGTELTALVADDRGITPLHAALPAGMTHYPALTPQLRAAFWYERAIHDLVGLVPDGHPRLDPLVLPHRDDTGRRLPYPGTPGQPHRIDPDERALSAHVHGTGVFTIPHGPVRSGVFESVEYLVETPGEDIPHLRIRPHHKHRGIQKRFEGMTVDDGVLLAERVEGIASVAHALAFAHAIEALAGFTGTDVPVAAAMTRVLHAELERIANHLDVLTKLTDAAGLAVATARFSLHKEQVLRLVSALCGSRFGRGVVVPGGVTALPRLPIEQIIAELDRREHAINSDIRALLGTSSFLDRVRTTGPLTPQLARAHGALGPIGRGSGVTDDCRVTRPYDGYRQLAPPPVPVRDAGDAQARMQVRIDEIDAAFDLARHAVGRLPDCDVDQLRVPVPPATGPAVGWSEAAQGEVLYLVELADDGRISYCAPRSASFHNLMLFPSTFVGDILTDFPFNEASFGLSIAGVVM